MGDRKRSNNFDDDDHKRQRSEHVLKMLCPAPCAGAIIGAGGGKIKSIKEDTGANVKVTKHKENYPGTHERVVSISGSLAAIQDVVVICQDLIRNDKPPEGVTSKQDSNRKSQVKLLVAGTSAGRIIGKGGEKINQLRKDHNVNIRVTKRDEIPEGLDENPISIEGDSDENVNSCAREIVECIMEDRNASMRWNVDYNEYFIGGGRDNRESYRGDSRGYSDSRGYNDSRSNNDSRDYGESRGYSDSRGYGDSRGFSDSRDYGDSRGYNDSRDYGESRGYSDSRGYGDSRSYSDSRGYDDSRDSRGYNDSRSYNDSRGYDDSRGDSRGGGYDDSRKSGYNSRDQRDQSGYSRSRY